MGKSFWQGMFYDREMLGVKRRTFLKLAGLTVLFIPGNSFAISQLITARASKRMVRPQPGRFTGKPHFAAQTVSDSGIKDYLTKIRNPDLPHADDIILDRYQRRLLTDVVHRLQRLSKTIGYGNFATLGFDEAIHFARQYRVIGAFTKAELSFLEMIFYRDASDYGFLGEKQIVDLTGTIKKGGIRKIPHSGNYLFQGESLHKYEKIKREMGDELVLTSGIRGLVKQFYLFLFKAYRHDANLSLASRSLAPPGYSFHASGDFDIGQRGLGKYNFSERFTTTSVFKQLAAQGYVQCRYPRDNMLGVRFEPWHVKL